MFAVARDVGIFALAPVDSFTAVLSVAATELNELFKESEADDSFLLSKNLVNCSAADIPELPILVPIPHTQHSLRSTGGPAIS